MKLSIVIKKTPHLTKHSTRPEDALSFPHQFQKVEINKCKIPKCKIPAMLILISNSWGTSKKNSAFQKMVVLRHRICTSISRTNAPTAHILPVPATRFSAFNAGKTTSSTSIKSCSIHQVRIYSSNTSINHV